MHRQLGQYGGRVAGLDEVEQLAVPRDVLVEVFEALGITPDSSVDHEAVEAYYAGV